VDQGCDWHAGDGRHRNDERKQARRSAIIGPYDVTCAVRPAARLDGREREMRSMIESADAHPYPELLSAMTGG
jgi:hypothetical protein